MHQPSAEPRPSIYYQYAVHAPWLPSQHGRQARKKVVIVGAGPAGLVTALELARHGVASVVLEAERQVSEGSRAIVFTVHTFIVDLDSLTPEQAEALREHPPHTA